MKRLVSIVAVALLAAACLPSGARADFGIDDFDLVFADARGDILTQAGDHPFALEISWDSNVSGGETEGKLRDLLLDLFPGLVASPISTPSCAREDFAELDAGVNDCPTSAAVGIVATSFDEAGKWAVAPVFSLVPSEGAVASFGFRAAGAENVVVDLRLSKDPPYRLVATVTDFPETVDLFAAKVQLWGVPADPAHDGLRGECGAYATTLPPGPAADFEFESTFGECPVSVVESPLLTLPTACEGPLATLYEVRSWEDEATFGSLLTHDEAGDPQGLTGCGSIAFSPLIEVRPTTKEAQTPTGLDFSLKFFDEGLLNPTGIAESTAREIVVALPEGMAAGSALTSGTGACSEADFAGEALGADSGEGCPSTSKVGEVDVESSLIGATLEGDVYRAIPFANAAEDAPMAVYVVVEDAGMGIFVKQVVAMEPDPETGQLVAFAEELPQLPFSDLDLRLEATSGTLINPPLCGNYKTVAEFVPWSDDSLYLATSAFEIISGPDGGPCSTGEGEPESQQGIGGPLASFPGSTTTSGPAPPIVVRRHHRCPKGKRRVRRNGKSRCLKKHRRKAGEHRYP